MKATYNLGYKLRKLNNLQTVISDGVESIIIHLDPEFTIRNTADNSLKEFYPAGSLESEIRIPITYFNSGNGNFGVVDYYPNSFCSKLVSLLGLTPLMLKEVRRTFYALGVPFLKQISLARKLNSYLNAELKNIELKLAF